MHHLIKIIYMYYLKAHLIPIYFKFDKIYIILNIIIKNYYKLNQLTFEVLLKQIWNKSYTLLYNNVACLFKLW